MVWDSRLAMTFGTEPKPGCKLEGLFARVLSGLVEFLRREGVLDLAGEGLGEPVSEPGETRVLGPLSVRLE